MLILDPAKNRRHNAFKLAAMVAKPQEITFYTVKGQVTGLLVVIQAPAITVSNLGDEARAAAPDMGVTQLDTERITVGFILQRSGNSSSFLRGVINTATGEGVLESCSSPVRGIEGGVAIAVSDGQPGYIVA